MSSSYTSSSPQRITIRLPDDFHHHVRDGAKTRAVLEHASKRFGRCIIMPNTVPPIVNTEQALKYRQFILDSLPPGGASSTFQPLMTLYLTDKTTPEEIKKAHATGMIHACKYYPAGATTNSEFGVTDVSNIYPALEAMQQVGMRLCIHSEVTHADIFEREPVFIQEIMQRIVPDFPSLYITMEHISTKEAVDYVLSAPDNVKATITCHHLMYNRNREYTSVSFKHTPYYLWLYFMNTCTVHVLHFYSLYYSMIIRFTCWRHSSSLVLFTNPQGRSPSSSVGPGRHEWKSQIFCRYRFRSS